MTARSPLSPVQGLARTVSIPPPPARPSPATQGQETPAAPTTAGQESPASARRTTRTAGPTRKSDEAHTTRAVTLSLPASIVTRVKDRARADRVSQPDVLMDAVSAALDNLHHLLEGEERLPVSDGIFVRRPTRRSSPEPMATLSLRLLARNVDVIDELVTRFDARSRSSLCAVALRNYLESTSGDKQRPS